MSKWILITFLIGLTGLAQTPLLQQQEQVEKSTRFLRPTTGNTFLDRLHFSFGTNLGYSFVDEKLSMSDSKDGIHFDLNALTSYRTQSLRFDLGGGWFHNKVSTNGLSVETQSAFLHLGSLYNFSHNFSFGPILESFLKVDNSFSEFNYEKSAKLFMGLQASYTPEPYAQNHQISYNLSYKKSMDIEDRDVHITTVGISISFPYHPIDRVIVEKMTNKTQIVFIGKDALRATLSEENGLNFNTNSSKPNLKMLKYVIRLAHFLKKYQSEWEKVIVSGHTDDVGLYDYNMKLSKDRANTLKSLLVKEGVAADRIETKGFGPTSPKVNAKTPRARFENRRVEVDFMGLKNPDGFLSHLEVIE